MKHAFVTAVLAASVLAAATVALAQPVVDLRSPRPRDVQSTVFTVTGTQDFRVDAVGAESASNRGTFSWITAIRLEKGDYILHYVSDDSHGYGGWNASAPRDTAHWGITLLSPGGTATRGRDR